MIYNHAKTTTNIANNKRTLWPKITIILINKPQQHDWQLFTFAQPNWQSFTFAQPDWQSFTFAHLMAL